MVFHPRQPWGVGPLKWQGIVYRLAPKFAAEIATTTGQVLSPEDMVERLDAHGLVLRLVAAHPAEIDALLEEALDIVRSAERRVGKEWVSTCRSGWPQVH